MLGSMVVSMIETAILQAYMKYRSRPKRVIPEQIRIQNRTHTVIKKIITALIWIIFLYGIYTFIPESYGASHEHDYNVWFYFIILSVFATIIILTSWIIVLKIMPSKQKTEAQKSE